VILFDTSVLSRVFRRRRPEAEERRLQGLFEGLMLSDAPLGLPGVVLQETLSGITSQKQSADLRAKLLASFTVIPATTQDHLEAARLKNTCLSKGLNVSGVDCLIAATAIAGDHRLFAVDEDFVAIAKHSSLRLFRKTGVGSR
jgi:predicted nucleic acid-binding protein